jgi:flagellar biosynthesis/type III secretory pathway protein FliH
MTAVIKSQAAAAVPFRSLTLSGGGAVEQRPPGELEQLRAEVTALLALAEARDAEIERLKASTARLVQEAETEGRKAGLAEAEKHEAERVQVLDKAVAQALERYSDALSGLESLGALLARAVLDRLFGEQGTRAAEVAAILRRQMAEIEARSLVRIEVSQADFPDAAAAAALAEMLGRPGLEIAASDQLAAGDCRLKLVLGTLEAGLGEQWGALRRLLDGAEDGAGRP